MTGRSPVLALLRSDPTGRRYGGIRLSFDSLQQLQELGHPVRFVAASDHPALRRLDVDGLAGWSVPHAPVRRRLRRGVPYQIAKRGVADEIVDRLASAVTTELGDQPPVLLLEQFPMFEWFDRLSEVFSASARILREHNDEPAYAAMIADHTHGAAKPMAIRERATVARLYRDRRFLDAFDAVIAISAGDDVSRYGFGATVDVVSPCLRPSAVAVDSPPTTELDFGVFGSLDHGPNVDAVTHLLTDVWPAVRARGGRRLLVAGHAPRSTVRRLVEATGGVELLADPDDGTAVYRRCAVMVDPSGEGSGVAVKTLEALTFGRGVVGYSPARRGLPPELAPYVRAVASAAELIGALTSSAPAPPPPTMATVTAVSDKHTAALSDNIERARRGG